MPPRSVQSYGESQTKKGGRRASDKIPRSAIWKVFRTNTQRCLFSLVSLSSCQSKVAENSREELCEVVRKKLELDSETNLELVQVRDGVVYDLEDGKIRHGFVSARVPSWFYRRRL